MVTTGGCAGKMAQLEPPGLLGPLLLPMEKDTPVSTAIFYTPQRL
jgi:hypothetical protein